MLKKLTAALLALCLLLPLIAGAEDAPSPTPVPTPAPTPIPIVPLTDEEIPDTPEGLHYYLLLCSDRSESTSDDPGNTDGIMLIALDTMANRMMLISFVRDMLVLRPDGVYGRINGISKRFSPEDMVATLNSHFGLRIKKYILVDWSGVAEIIDALGGVDLTLTNGEAIRLKDKMAYMSDWAQPELNGAGAYRLRGYAAVTYMRIRSETPVNGEQYDYRRTSRARAVIASLVESLRSISWQSALQLATSTIWNCISGTNLTLADVVEAATITFSLRSAEVEQFRVPIDGTGDEFIYLNMATQQIDVPANREALQNFLFNTYTVQGTGEEWD